MPPAAPLVIWPDNAATVRVFLAMTTQWEWAPGAGRRRMIYEALDRPMRSARVPDEEQDAVFAGLQVMEVHVLKLQTEDRKAT